MKNPSSFAGSPKSTGRLLVHLVLLGLLGFCIIAINPRGFIGGSYDDGRYLAAATRWAMEGPVLGQNHWSLRWPLVLPTAAIIWWQGLDFAALMIPGILSWAALILVNYFGLRAAVSERAAFLGALGILATPGIAYWSAALYPDLGEAALWSAAFWSLWRATHVRPGGVQTRWLIAAGLLTGLAFCVRETSAGLAIGLVLAMAFLPRLPFRAWVIAGVSAAILPVAEYAILWAASGDPIYRLHVDMRHIAIASDDMVGGAAEGQRAVFNADVMKRWEGAGPVHLHWAVDTWINFFLNIFYGLNYLATAVLACYYVRRRRAAFPPGRVVQGLIPALLALGTANILWNLYVLALNPSDRMFIPATIAVALSAAVLADRLWHLRCVRLFVGVVMAAKILSTLIVVDTLPNYHHSAAVAQRIVPASGPIHVSWRTHSHLALAAPALRTRLTLQPAKAGDIFLVYTDLDAPVADRLPTGRWQRIRAEPTGHYPHVIALANRVTAGLGQPSVPHADVEVRLFRRLPGEAQTAIVVP